MSEPKWIKGAPTKRGRYWIVWKPLNGAREFVEPVAIEGAVIDPYGPLLIKTLLGIAYRLEKNAGNILAHAPLEVPPLPGPPRSKESAKA